MNLPRWCWHAFVILTWVFVLPFTQACLAEAPADDDALLFTPAGFSKPGEPKTELGPESGTLRIVVIDETTGKPTPCRLNVVGPGRQLLPTGAESAHALQPDRPLAQDRQR